ARRRTGAGRRHGDSGRVGQGPRGQRRRRGDGDVDAVRGRLPGARAPGRTIRPGRAGRHVRRGGAGARDADGTAAHGRPGAARRSPLGAGLARRAGASLLRRGAGRTVGGRRVGAGERQLAGRGRLDNAECGMWNAELKDQRRSALQPPVLCYHRIGGPAELGVTRVAKSVFARQMTTLARAGWKTLTLDQFAERLQPGYSAFRTPHSAFLLTFDDGYASFAEHVYPILAEVGFTATTFLITDYVGR